MFIGVLPVKGSSMSKKKEQPPIQMPDLDLLEVELGRVKYKSRFRQTLMGTLYALITVAAVAILVATLWLPVLQITGTSMTPTMYDGEIVVSMKNANLVRGDLVAFYYNNRVLVKRVIAMPGEWVNIDEDGNVYINDVFFSEPYLVEKAVGECNIELPYQVPEGRLFVMGDHRSVSVDSRSKSVGCVAEEQIVGKLIMRIWPLSEISMLQ